MKDYFGIIDFDFMLSKYTLMAQIRLKLIPIVSIF